MKPLKFMAVAAAGIFSAAYIAGLNLKAIAATPASDASIVDASGNMHVPDGYRTSYQLPGSWAIAGEPGQGSKELHVVYASPGATDAYRKDGHFPDDAGPDQRGLSSRHDKDDDRTSQPCRHAQGLVRHGQRRFPIGIVLAGDVRLSS